MRLRLVHTLSLWLLSAVGLSVLAMGAVAAWHLQQGFSAYLQARDTERLEKFVQVVADSLEAAGGDGALQQRRVRMPQMLRELARREGLLDALPDLAPPPDEPPPGPAPPPRGPMAWLRPPPPGPPQGRPGDAPPQRPDDGMRGPAGGPPPARGGNADAFGARVALFSPDGQLWMGRPLPPGPAPWVERPVMLDGRTVLLARLRPLARAPEGLELNFLRAQYQGIAAVAAVLMLLALAAAWWLARQWGRPLAAVQEATARIARGELAVRLPSGRADEFGDLVRNVNAMAESLQRIEGARRRWMADMSHELRTPLAGLRGEIEALIDGVRPLTPTAVASLHEDVLRLGALVDDLHLLAMADLQSLPCRPAETDAAAQVQRLLMRYQARAAAVGLALSGPAGSVEARSVCWDAARIDQVLGNLLDNSLRYTDRPGRISVGLVVGEQNVLLTVDDSGPGVADADLARIFEPLYRADAARSRHNGGSGLGLAICAAIVASHGGQIRAGASPLGGLQVQVNLPRQSADATP